LARKKIHLSSKKNILPKKKYLMGKKIFDGNNILLEALIFLKKRARD
jgi:hypothetical protein